jgi:histidinol-phosphate aminotransferase
MSVYSPPTFGSPIEIDLSKNEGVPGPASAYPDSSRLRSILADRMGVGSDQVLVTAGGDDALFRCFLANANRRIVATRPSFEMIRRYAAQVGANLTEVAWWDQDFPIDEFAGSAADVAVVVSPNNPTGSAIDAQVLAKVASRFELVVFDAAYAEFADEDLTEAALDLGNVVIVRTLSKAFGLAGLRVGYLVGPAELISSISAYGNPYPVSSVSLRMAEEALVMATAEVEGNRGRRERLSAILEQLGATPLRSQANFVLASGVEADWLVSACASLGIGIRAFPDRLELEGCVRITVPRDEVEMARLESALRTAFEPEALLFDLDGVLADVSGSYRATVIETARSFGVTIGQADIDRIKAAGQANDDWEVTRRLCVEAGVEVRFEEVVARFEAIYQGDGSGPGLKENEKLLVDGAALERLGERYSLGIVTGRPRRDTDEFLDRFGLTDRFDTVVTREDALFKPDPAPVRLAMERLDVTRAWMLGDTRDDLESARAAGALPIAVGSTELQPAATSLQRADQIEELAK